jgi:glutamate/tyrosine decarboxylase-like PLP-dependent enzyme
MATTEFDAQQDLKKFDPIETSLKSFFLGPKAENADMVTELVQEIFQEWYTWRRSIDSEDGIAITPADKNLDAFQLQNDTFREKVREIIARFHDEIPTFSPRYIGHMVTEISLPALLGHIITLLHNPNNITGEASRIGIQVEDEAIADLAEMMGYDREKAVGHFTSGGTVANFEGLLRGRSRMAKWLTLGALAKTQGEEISLFDAAHMGWEKYDELYGKLGADESVLAPYHLQKNNPFEIAEKLNRIFGVSYKGPVLLVPENKHYSWEKAVSLIGLGKDAFWPVALDKRGKQDVNDLRRQIERARSENRPILAVISVAGTTELGDFDPIHEVNELLEEYRDQGIHLWHHVDAAYGGFFCSLDTEACKYISDSMKQALNAIGKSNSITTDPHKLGYVPYASGAFMCSKAREYYASDVNAPYIDFKEMLDKGPQTIEGSRSAAGAVSTWLTSKTIGLNGEGYGKILSRTIKARVQLEHFLKEASPLIKVVPHSETNICCFCVARENEPVSITNKRTLAVYKAYSSSENHPFYVSKTTLFHKAYKEYLDDFVADWNGQFNTEGIVLIRLTLMNPFFTTQETEIHYPEAFVEDLVKTISDIG